MKIDRLSPARRPAGKNSGTQRWESLLFCHWEVSVRALRPLVPRGLELDLYDGRAFVGLVPFKMRNIRPSWFPNSWSVNFYETNVRTYVTCQGRPGVYFFSLDASSLLAVAAARLGWSLPYFYADMSSEESDAETVYRCRRRFSAAKSSVRFVVGHRLGNAEPGTLEHFLFERYLLFVEANKQMYVGQVHHPPYEIYQARVLQCDDTLVSSAGFPNIDGVPSLSHYSPAVDVEVFAIEPDFGSSG